MHLHQFYIHSLSSTLSCSIFERSAAEVFFDILAKETGVGKVEFVCYLLHTKFGVEKIVCYIGKKIFGDPLIGSLARVLLADDGEVLGGDAQFGGKVLQRLVLLLGVLKQVEETVEDGEVMPHL